MNDSSKSVTVTRVSSMVSVPGRAGMSGAQGAQSQLTGSGQERDDATGQQRDGAAPAPSEQNEIGQQQLYEVLQEAEKMRAELGTTAYHQIVASLYQKAEDTAQMAVRKANRKDWDRRIDDVLTSRIFGYPIMLFLLAGVFWLTIQGANYPSALLADLLFGIEDRLTAFFQWIQAPTWLYGFLVTGVYRTLAWVVSVMLPPMAIFFPLFTLLEDLGYLPRIAFNMDGLFRRVGAHGKQSLTMAMGFGCNAAGVIAARIIQSPRERLIAILTNTFVPCNGRFPTLFTMAAIFFGGGGVASFSGSLISSGVVLGIVMLGVLVTLGVSWLLSHTVLKGMPSNFTLELPPYRPPQIGKVIVRSIFDRTLFVLKRAVVIAAPAGGLIWILANVTIGGISLLSHAAGFLDPFAVLIGLDGVILLAFLLGLPANEIVVPIILMSYLATGTMIEIESIATMRTVLMENGWTWLTGLNMLLFSLLHFPCGTTLLTIKKETSSLKWTLLAFALPTTIAMAVCFLVTQFARLINLI